MSENLRGSNWQYKMLGLGILLVAVWFLTPLPMVVGVVYETRRTARIESRMQRPEIFGLAATNLALYCQSFAELGLGEGVGAACLPQPIPALGRGWGRFETNQADIEFGGGFYGFGYLLERDELESSPDTNSWVLKLKREGQSPLALHRFTLPATAHIPRAVFTSNSLAEYDRRLAKDSGDLSLHEAKIAFALRYAPELVRSACLDAAASLPKHWWPRLTLAFVDTGRGHAAEAQSELLKFMASHPSYSRFIYLAYFYQMTGDPAHAAEAVERAITYPPADLADDKTNAECRGYSAGVYLFANRKYATVIKLCDFLLPIEVNGVYAKAALSNLKSAAEAAIGGAAPSFHPDERVLGFNPYERFNIKALLVQRSNPKAL